MPRIFVSQRRVQQWTEEGRVTIDGNTMTLPELGRSFRLTEAFFIERMVAGSSDTLKLAGRVKTRNQIAVLGGEVFLNSLLIGDDAYEGDPGFVGEPIVSARSGKNASSRTDGVAGPSQQGAVPTVGSGRVQVSASAKTVPKTS